MKTWSLLVPITAFACSGAPSGTEEHTEPPPPAGAGVALSEPVRLTGGLPAIAGVTSDDFVAYRETGGLSAIAMQGGAQPMLITDRPGTTLVSGKVVFAWADVDWTTNLGNLGVWSAATGPLHVGITLFLEGTAGASASGTYVLYTTNVTETTVDIVVARTDMTQMSTLVAGVGRGSETTCAARYGFVGERIFVGSCSVGSTSATVVRYEADAQGVWQPTQIASDSRSLWSASADGERVAIIDSRSVVNWWEAGQLRPIDDGVAWAKMLPDASAVLYTAGDQLRRADLPSGIPVPIVTVGFRNQADWSPDFSQVLYSTQVTYEAGTRRDLRLTSTQIYNPEPLSLVAEPTASISRSAFTKDSAYTMYLTDVTAERRSTLNLRPIAGGETRTIPNVDTVLALSGSIIVYSADRTDPNKYPVKATLSALNTAHGEPVLIEDTIMDGRAFATNAAGDKIVYVRVDADHDREGIYVQNIAAAQE